MPKIQQSIHDTPVASHLNVERAIDELRRQSGVVIREGSQQAVGYFPVEFLDGEIFSRLRSPRLSVLITAARAKSLGVAQHDVHIDAEHLSLHDIMAIADPLATTPLPSIKATPAGATDAMALRLAKYASLLPALLLVQESSHTASWHTVSAHDLQHYITSPLVDTIETAHATLPIEGAENARIVSFRSTHSTAVHLALIVGEASGNAPLTRIHSSCVTGDILGSLRCDCGDQLKLALQQITRSGYGVLVYLHQEGRGIGITNKLRAYRLQEMGIDTYQANLMLGFEEDERDFNIAAAILRKLGISTIRMLTNNPHKMAALEKTGIKIAERVPLIAPSGRHNHAYMDAKAQKSGHLF